MSDVSHIREDSDVRSFPRLSLQPPLRLELMRVFTPEGLIAIKTQTNDSSDQDREMGREAYRLQAATETTTVNPLGIGTWVRTFPEAVVIGLKSGNTSSLTVFFKILNATGWNRKFSCSHEPWVNSYQESETGIDKP